MKPDCTLGLIPYFAMVSASCVSALVLVGIVLAHLDWFVGMTIAGPLVVVATALASHWLISFKLGIPIRPQRWEAWIVVACLTWSVWNGANYHESILGEQDAGIYSLSAVHLSETGTLQIEKVSGEPVGTYAGFHSRGSTYSPQFLPAYIVFLGFFHQVGDMNGLFLAGSVISFLSLLCLFSLGTALARNWMAGLLACAIWASRYETIWFSRQTLSENLFVLLSLGGTLGLVMALDFESNELLPLALAPFLALSATRVEGPIFLLAGFSSFLLASGQLRGGATSVRRRVAAKARILIAALGLAALGGGLAIATNTQYLADLFEILLRQGNPPGLGSGQGTQSKVTDYVLRYTWQSLDSYLTIILILLTAGGVVLRTFGRGAAVVAGTFCPSLALFFVQTISLQHPWFMRHHWAVTLPPLIIMAASAVSGAHVRGFPAEGRTPKLRRRLATKHGTAVALATLILASNLALASPLLAHKENRGLLDSLEWVGERLPEESNVLVTEDLAGASAPLWFLFNISAMNSVGVFSRTDFSGLYAARVAEGKPLFVLSPRTTGGSEHTTISKVWYDGDLQEIARRSFNLTFLRLETSAIGLGLKGVHWDGYLPFERSFDNIPPSDIESQQRNWIIYKVRDNSKLRDFYLASRNTTLALSDWREGDDGIISKALAARVNVWYLETNAGAAETGTLEITVVRPASNLSVTSANEDLPRTFWVGNATYAGQVISVPIRRATEGETADVLWFRGPWAISGIRCAWEVTS